MKAKSAELANLTTAVTSSNYLRLKKYIKYFIIYNQLKKVYRTGNIDTFNSKSSAFGSHSYRQQFYLKVGLSAARICS